MCVLASVLREDASYRAVLRAAGELAGGEPIKVLSLYPAPAYNDQGISFKSPAHRTATARDAIKTRIEEDLAVFSLNAVVSVPVARLNNLGDDIVERAREADASVIVIGTHGRTGLSRFFVGSVAERVVRNAHCDVYVARPPEAVQD